MTTWTSIPQMKNQYRAAAEAATGTFITCPGCGKRIRKSTYQKKFCGTKCKDRYWNNVDPRKKNRKHKKSHYSKYNVGLKSYANRLGKQIALQRGYPSHAAMIEAQNMDDPSWDAHGGVEIEPCEFCGMMYEYCQCGEH